MNKNYSINILVIQNLFEKLTHTNITNNINQNEMI